MDIKAAYLSGELDCKRENIYIHILKSVTVTDSNKMTCQIVKELYRLKQSARLKHKKLTSLIKTEGFQAININLSILVRKVYRTVIIVSIYVNNLLIASQTLQKVSHIKAVLNEAFEMSDLEKARVIVGFRIIRDQNKHTLTLNQTLYVEEVL